MPTMIGPPRCYVCGVQCGEEIAAVCDSCEHKARRAMRYPWQDPIVWILVAAIALGFVFLPACGTEAPCVECGDEEPAPEPAPTPEPAPECWFDEGHAAPGCAVWIRCYRCQEEGGEVTAGGSCRTSYGARRCEHTARPERCGCQATTES